MVTKISSRAPTRIDLAGGTLDVWPLYLFLNHPITLNLGIDLFAEADVVVTPSERGNAHFILASEDQAKELKFDWPKLLKDPQMQGIPPALELHWKLLYHFAHEKLAQDHQAFDFNLKLSTRAKSPAGAGLGGSSALSIAMIGALATWAHDRVIDPEREGETFIQIVRDVETTVIKVPAGIQDYYGAMFGGLQSLHWGFGSHRRAWLPDSTLAELDKRLILFYSGQSRNSGINNWILFKGFIDNQEGVREKFEKIAQASQVLDHALKAQDWAAAGQAIADEWATRKTLAPGISTPEINSAFAEAARVAPVSGKICGAGGGGCFFIYLPSANAKERDEIILRLGKLPGIRHLPFASSRRGVDVLVSRA